MVSQQQWRKAPERIVTESRGERVTWHRCTDCYALEGEPPGKLGTAVRARLPVEDVAIVNGAPSEILSETAHVLPVYRSAPGAAPAVATGRLFVRLAEGSAAADERERFEGLGLAIVDVPSYAPHCAWVAAASGRASDALVKLDEVRALPGVEHVEPQLLQARSFR
jgi:hypothetical protein